MGIADRLGPGIEGNQVQRPCAGIGVGPARRWFGSDIILVRLEPWDPVFAALVRDARGLNRHGTPLLADD